MAMEKCPACGGFTAERSHYSEDLICYNRACRAVTRPDQHYTGKADLTNLNHKDGGIPETGRVNKNRTKLFWFDRTKHKVRDLDNWIEEALLSLAEDEIDTIIIDVKERTW